MRCSKARELCFGNCDGLLDEAQKMKLAEHLDECPSCASFVEEIEACREMLKGLPEVTLSENFEWNLKRRILQEKSRLIRTAGGSYLRDVRWGMKFVTSAAAVIVVALIGAWFMFGEHAVAPEYGDLARKPATVRNGRDVSIPRLGQNDFAGADRSPGMRMVSDAAHGLEPGTGVLEPQAFLPAADSRMDSVLMENEYLKWHIQRIEYENLILKQVLYRTQSQRRR
jgi:hypothetical protein